MTKFSKRIKRNSTMNTLTPKSCISPFLLPLNTPRLSNLLSREYGFQSLSVAII